MKNRNRVAKRKSFKEAVSDTPDVAHCYQSGLQALSKFFRAKIQATDTNKLGGSVDLDECVKHIYPNENRWDYILGYSGMAYFIEFHSANTGEVSVMLNKLSWLKNWLHTHAPEINKIKATQSAFIWIQSNGNHILKNSSQERRIAQAGLRPVSKLILQ